MMGILGVDSHAGQTIAILWSKMLCMGPIWMIGNHHSGLGPWNWYHTPNTNNNGAYFGMVEDPIHDGDIRC